MEGFAGVDAGGDHVGAMEHRATFELAPEAASRARAVVNDELGRAVPPRILEDATLLVSELVTNAVRHASRARASRRSSCCSRSTPGGFGSWSPTPEPVSTPTLGCRPLRRAPGGVCSSWIGSRIGGGSSTKDRNEVWFEIDVAG